MSESVPLLGADGVDEDHDLQKSRNFFSKKKGGKFGSGMRLTLSISLAVFDAIISVIVLFILLLVTSNDELTEFLELEHVPTFAHFSLTINIASVLSVVDVCGPLILRLAGLRCFFVDRNDAAKDLMSFSFLYLVFRLYISMFDPIRFQLTVFHKVYILLWAVLSAVQATLFKDIAKFEEAFSRGNSTEDKLTFNRKTHDTETASSSSPDATDEESSISSKNERSSDDDMPAGSMASKPKKAWIDGLGALRFFGVLHILAIHFYSNSASTVPIVDGGDGNIWYMFSGWGCGQLVLFFVLSGFVLAYTNSENCKTLCTYTFWLRRFAKLYPPYLISIVAMCILLPQSQIDWQDLTVLLTGTQAWITFAYDNPINTTGWSVGVFLFLSMIFPPSFRILSGTTKTSDLLLMLCWFWPLAVFGATIQAGIQLGQAFMPLYELIFRAHVSEFLFGVVLGHMFLLNPIEKVTSTRLGYFGSKIGATLGVVALNVVYMTVDVNGNGLYFSFIGAYGLMIPVYAVMIWFSVTNQDVILSGVFSSRLFTYLGSISYQMYIFGTLAHEISVAVGIPDLTVFVGLVIAALMKVIEKDMALVTTVTVELSLRLYPIKAFLNWIKSGNIYNKPTWLKMLLYYLTMCSFLLYVFSVNAFRLYGSQSFIYVQNGSIAITILNVFHWMALVGGPGAIITIIGQISFCPWRRVVVPEIAELLPLFKNRMYWRFVTRGLHPLLVRQNALEALHVLSSCLPPWAYTVEVVTDNRMDILGYLQEQTGSLDIGFHEVVVPTSFQCTSGAKYKARALHYAILNSRASDTDWVIHLDEETRFDVDTVKHTLAHCVHSDMLVSHGKQVFGDIGQGVILYGANKEIDNYITTLADSCRVGEDFGKFRLQYHLTRPLIGMHGSFVVCPNAVEKHVGFDNGMPGSITEDAYFSLVAWERGIKFAWVNAYMYEQSPFSIYDFIMQRRRWFGGLWLVSWDPAIKWPYRLTLLFMFTTWAFGGLPYILSVTTWIVSFHFDPSSYMFLAVVSAIFAWSYALGFMKTYSIYDGIVRYFVLLFLQLTMIPIFAIMEFLGFSYAVINPPFNSFHIVKKEGKAVTG